MAKDRPNFIANHIGIFSVDSNPESLRIRRLHDRGNRCHDRTGARPAQERHVSHDGRGRTRRHRATSRPIFGCRSRAVLQSLVERGWIGEKGGPGFLQARRDRKSSCSIRRLLRTGRQKPVQIPALEATRNIEDPAERVKTRVSGPGEGRTISSGDAWPDAAPYGARRVRYRVFDRRRRSRDAMGIRLGARAVRDLGCDRRTRGARCDAGADRRSTCHHRSGRFSMPAAIDSAATASRRRRRTCRF